MPNKDESAGFAGFRKRNNMVVPFRRTKIESAILRAAEAADRMGDIPLNPTIPSRVTDQVLCYLNDPKSDYYVYPNESGHRIPDIEDVQDLVEIVLAEQKYTTVVAAYKRYRKQRQRARERIRVRDAAPSGAVRDTTDASLLLVESNSRDVTTPWDRARIVAQLSQKTALSQEVINAVAKAVENQIIAAGFRSVGTTLIRELVNNELVARGYREQLRDLSIYGVSKDFVDRLMDSKSVENSNIVNNNPEAVNLGIAELVLKQWALDTIFSPEIKTAHQTGAVHVHDLGYPHRVYCSSHSIEYVKKYGLRDLVNLNTESKPARSASVLTGHINTFLASMQANYAGALGLGYVNIFYAPYLKGMDAAQRKQVAQELVFNGAQNAFSRGGQTLFLDFNLHTGVPAYLRGVPAIGPGGHYMLRRADGTIVPIREVLREDRDAQGNRLADLVEVRPDGRHRVVLREQVDERHGVVRDPVVEAERERQGESLVTYGDYETEARAFAEALLEVWAEGDRNGRVFEFPKCDFHISEETFSCPEALRLFHKACELAARNGSTYFVFDRDEVTLSACCRLRTTIEDNRMLRHPESMRFCGFQNVTINIPQAAYRAARAGRRNLQGLMAETDRMMELAAQAHVEKRDKTEILMSGPGWPLHQIGRPACDGRPYVELDKCTYIVGLIGVNDAMRFITGCELHENEEVFELALRLTAHMYRQCKKLAKKYGIKITLEETPAESASRRLAKADLLYYRDEALATVKGEDEDTAYYTNSVHLAPDAPVSLVERIRLQGRFHALIESGAITHAFIGEEQPSADAIARLVRETFFRTQSAQLTISPEFTYCNRCRHTMRGLVEACERCGSEDVEGETRVVGYFSRVRNWNKSKRYGELVARRRGQYQVDAAPDPATPDTEPVEAALVYA